MLWLCDCDFGVVTPSSCYMYGISFGGSFCIPPPCILFSARLCVLNCQCQPFSSQATCFLHMQDGFQWEQMCAKGQWSKCVLMNTKLRKCTKDHHLFWIPAWSHLRSVHCHTSFLPHLLIDLVAYIKEMLVNNLTWCFDTLSTVQ